MVTRIKLLSASTYLRNTSDQRRGATVVEFAFVVPIFFLFLLAFFELGHGLMLDSILENAAYEGARQSITPGATTDMVKQAAENIAKISTLKNPQLTVSPPVITPATETVTVTVSTSLSESGLIIGRFLKGSTISRSVTMIREPSLRLQFPPEQIDILNPTTPKPRGRGKHK